MTGDVFDACVSLLVVLVDVNGSYWHMNTALHD